MDRPRNRRAPASARLLGLSAGAGAGVLILHALVVGTTWGQRLDERALIGHDFLASRSAQADAFLEVVSIGTLVLATLLVVGLAFARRRPRLALVAAVSIVASLVCTELLKMVILERPPLIGETLIVENSYPSGHTTVGMSIAVAVMLVAPRRALIGVAIGAGLVGAAFGVAVVAAGWHRPSDAVGAFGVVLSVAAACAAVARRYPDRPDLERGSMLDRAPSIQLGPVQFGVAALVLCALGLLALAGLSYKGIPWTSTSAGFLLSALAIVATALFTTLLLAATMLAADRVSETHGTERSL